MATTTDSATACNNCSWNMPWACSPRPRCGRRAWLRSPLRLVAGWDVRRSCFAERRGMPLCLAIILQTFARLRNVLGWILSVFRCRDDLVLENVALRQQLQALHRSEEHTSELQSLRHLVC